MTKFRVNLGLVDEGFSRRNVIVEATDEAEAEEKAREWYATRVKVYRLKEETRVEEEQPV